MSTQRDRDYGEEELAEHRVAQYLRNNPEFFIRNPDVALQLQIPHECGSAVSLVEYQISVLRDHNRQLKRKLKDLVQTGRDNDRLSERVLGLTRALLAADSLESTLAAVQQTLVSEFHAEALALRVFGDSAAAGEFAPCMIARDDPALAPFSSFFKSNRPLCGRLKREQLEFLFADQATAIGSAALVGLGDYARFGMLAVGSRDENHFHPAMGTLYLSRMGLLIGYALRRHLAEPVDE